MTGFSLTLEGRNFYPRSPCGERLHRHQQGNIPLYFYPRSPCGERLAHRLFFVLPRIFLSTLSLRRATPHGRKKPPAGGFLSTLSLRRATSIPFIRSSAVCIFLSTLSLRRATTQEVTTMATPKFLSTLSLRRATTRPAAYLRGRRNFYPRSPCGERLFALWMARSHLSFLSTLSLRRATLNLPSSPMDKNISIHALLAESDVMDALKLANTMLFLSTLSLRRATGKVRVVEPGLLFLSTLSLRRATLELFLYYQDNKFLSTLSLRRATGEERANQSEHCISIHALLAESDIISPHSTPDNGNFYPRSPCGERRLRLMFWPFRHC